VFNSHFNISSWYSPALMHLDCNSISSANNFLFFWLVLRCAGRTCVIHAISLKAGKAA